ncbi:MAG: hypothetical protein C0432_02365 [Candidatus Puniceispirillum sp.]|nr:hypothetical protein [Candidatus Pelagibacter sp.]MBA4283119.1 hypothetical protein [Candidatus Puniceispirillum sp.]
MLVQINTSSKENNKILPIGIDLGTTHTVISFAKDRENIEILQLKNEEELIPSVVAFDEFNQSWICGSQAQKMDSYFSSFKPHLNQPFSSVDSCDKKTQSTPFELTLTLLKFLKKSLNDFFQYDVKDIVLTVPAYFDDTARQATKDAAFQAGFNVLRLLSEPTAAALSYHLDDIDNGYFLVFDFGGGTFDCSLLNFKRGIFNVKATKGNCFLGGDDIDKEIVSFWKEDLVDQSKQYQEMELIQFAREAKEDLSNKDVWKKNELKLTRLDLVNLSKPLLDQTIDICKDVIFDSNIDIEQMNKIVLVGGSSKLWGLKERLGSIFEDHKILCTHNPDTVVAKGAALQALKLLGGEGYVLLDVSPLSLGIETFGGLMEVIIPRNSTLPCSFSQKFTTYEHNQTAISFHVLQGESDLVEKCVSLGRFVMKDLPAYPAGFLEVSVGFQLDTDGLLKVAAHEEKTGIQCTVDMHATHHLSDQRKKEIMLQAYSHLDEDFITKNIIDLKMKSLRLIKSCEFALAQSIEHIPSELINRLIQEKDHLSTILNSDILEVQELENALEILKQTSSLFAEEHINKSLKEKFVGQNIDR